MLGYNSQYYIKFDNEVTVINNNTLLPMSFTSELSVASGESAVQGLDPLYTYINVYYV